MQTTTTLPSPVRLTVEAAPRPRTANRTIPLLVAVLVAAAHFAWLYHYFSPATMSADANGYVVQARLLATQHRAFVQTTSPAQYVGLHWLETRDGVFQSRYPAGLPLLMAAGWSGGGITAALLLNLVLASGSVLLTFLLARRLVGGWAAVFAALVVALAADANEHALCSDAHTATTFFLLGGLWLLFQFDGNRKAWTGFVGGLLLGIVPTIRYPEALAGVAIAAWLAWRIRPLWRAWPAAVGALIPITGQLWHNASAFGSIWRTGYALTNEQSGFSLRYLSTNAFSYLHSLSASGLGLFFVLGALGLAAMTTSPRARVTGRLLAGIVAPLLVLYMSYYFNTGTGNMRFLIPLYPLLAIAGVWLLERIASALVGHSRVFWSTAIGLQLVLAGGYSFATLRDTGSSLAAAAQMRDVVRQNLPAGGVIIADRPMDDSLDATGEWNLVDEGLLLTPKSVLQPARGGGVPRTPSPIQANKNRLQLTRYRGLTPMRMRERVWSDIETWAKGRPIFWITHPYTNLRPALPPGTVVQTVTEFAAPGLVGLGLAGGPEMGNALEALSMLTGQGPPLGMPPGLLPGAGEKLRLIRIQLPAHNASTGN